MKSLTVDKRVVSARHPEIGAGLGDGTSLPRTGSGGTLERRTPKEAAAQFAERASLFSGKIFVNLVVYADESGTHDRMAKQPGSEAAVFGGYIGDVTEDWILFNWEWQSVLEKYKIKHFHCREFFSLKGSEHNPESPYYKWGELKRDTFLFELAAAAGDQYPVGAMFNLKDYVKNKESEDPYPFVFHTFFSDVHRALRLQWPGNTGPVSFFLDNNNADWISTFREVFNKWKIHEPRFDSFTFADDRTCLPLQAADLIAYRVRKGALRHLETRVKVRPCLLDHFLFRRRDRDPKQKRDTAQWRQSAARAARRSRDEKFAVKLPEATIG
jgi:hypothetical protein